MEADKQEKTDNELIAEFMGYKQYGYRFRNVVENQYTLFDNQDQIWTTSDFLYHESWNQLMPVVEKINETIHPTLGERVDVIIYRRTCHINDQEQIIIETTGKNMLDCTYKAVVEFIKWFNSQKPLPL